MSATTVIDDINTYTIIGSGNVGSALARQLGRARIGFSIANTRGPDSLRDLVEEIGGTVVAKSVEAAVEADIVILAVPFDAVEAIARLRDDWTGTIIVDATNAFGVKPEYLAGRLPSDIVAGAFRGAAVVKAFNYLPARVLVRDPSGDGGRRVMFVAGNHDEANTAVVALADRLGFAPIILGRIDDGGRLLNPSGPLLLHNLIEYPLN